MFYIRHPKPVGDGRAVAMQVVSQKSYAGVDKYLLMVERPGAAPTAVPAAIPAKKVE